LLIVPGNNSNLDNEDQLARRGADLAAPVAQLKQTPCDWLATMDPSVGAGFYAGVWGPLPVAFGDVKPTHFRVLRLGPVPAAKGSP
jgi:hypothetical protein